MRVIGIEVDTSGPGRSGCGSLAPQEEEELRNLAASPNVYETLAKSIAPSIFGSADIKKAITCLLFGGSRKRSVQRFTVKKYSYRLRMTSFICY